MALARSGGSRGLLLQLLLRAVVAASATEALAAEREAGGADRVDAAVLSKVAFGSCSKQWEDQAVWLRVAEAAPDAFVLAGDAYYTGSKQFAQGEESWDPLSIEALQHAARTALASREFQTMLAGLKVPLMGTYDDHDRGVNDGGGISGGFANAGVSDRDVRKNVYLDFLGASEDDPRRARQGVYGSHLLGTSPHLVKVLLLDTRYSRAPYVIPSVGTVKGLSPLAALSRLFTAVTGLVSLQTGPFLGEEQWAWLAGQLAHSAEHGVAINVLVSSVQVFTSNPLVESWGHFPRERERLLSLLRKHDPSGLVIISGDVHVGEAIQLGPGLEPVEFTSSGITHDCSDGFIPKTLCRLAWGAFGAHQATGGLAFLPERNFGVLEVDWDERAVPGSSSCPFRSVNVSVRDARGHSAISFSRTTCRSVGVVLPPSGDLFEMQWAFRTSGARAFWTLSLLIAAIAAVAGLGMLLRKCLAGRGARLKLE